MNISIVGAGISGISAAYYLNRLCRDNGIEAKITVYEKSSRPGGNISTIRKGDFIIEEGVDSFITSKPWAMDLCKELGIEEKLFSTNDQYRKTYIYFDGKHNELPEGFFLLAPSNIEAFKKSSFFSESEKNRILDESNIPPNEGAGDETLESFVERRFGRELLEKVAQPLIGGIYTGDPAKLSMNSILPEIVSMEKQYGSVIKGITEKYGTEEISKTESGARYSLFVSFREGMSELTESVIKGMPEVSINFNEGIRSVKKEGEGWLLETDGGGIVESDGVVLAVRTYAASELISETDVTLSGLLSRIEYESSVLVNFVFNKDKTAGIPKGFGVVIPKTEQLNLFACSLYSNKFEGRVPENYEVVRCFLGGAFNPGVMDKNDNEILELVSEDLNKLFGIESQPEQSYICRYPNSMPQYGLGHSEIVENIDAALNNFPTLALCGNAFRGVGIPDSIRSGKEAADRIYTNCIELK